MLEYIEEDFAAEIEAGVFLLIDDTDSFFQKIGERFPIGLNRIAWDQIPKKQHIEIRPLESGSIAAEEVEKKLANQRQVVAEWLESEDVSRDEMVYWVGDDTSAALRMSVESLLRYFPGLFSFGQHSYVVPENASWCLNYVMEGELFFAISPNQIR